MAKEYILCAAVHYMDGKTHKEQPLNITTGIVVAGRRHNNCIRTLEMFVGYDSKGVSKDSMGFITNTNRFLNRKEAYIVARDAGQLQHDLHDKSNPILTSECLYFGYDDIND